MSSAASCGAATQQQQQRNAQKMLDNGVPPRFFAKYRHGQLTRGPPVLYNVPLVHLEWYVALKPQKTRRHGELRTL